MNRPSCAYFEILNKRILIQQRALAWLSKSLAHVLQRNLYTMGNTGLLRREAEMTLLDPHLGNSRHQELRRSPFWVSLLFKSRLVKGGEEFILTKGFTKDSQGFAPYQNMPFHDPHQAVTDCFPQVGEIKQRLQSSFQGTRVWKPLLPMTPKLPLSIHQEVASVLSEETGNQTSV